MSVFDKVKSIFAKEKPSSAPGGPKIWSMPPEVQQALERGVKYNMKVVIRGMRNTGKSALLARLNGHAVAETYIPSTEISAATTFHLSPNEPETEGAKVEIWDVVDEGAAKASSVKGVPAMPIDASSIEIYRGCNGVIFMVDAQRRETLDYVENEMRKVPITVAVLICLNFHDSPSRAVQDIEVERLCQSLKRATTPLIRQASSGEPSTDLAIGASWVPTSMKTGVGLHAVRTFFNIPVAMVKMETLENGIRAQLRRITEIKAELLQIRAEQNFIAKTKVVASEPEREVAQQPPPPSPAPQSGKPAVRAASTTAQPSQKQPVDPSKIDDSFFDDVSDEDEKPAKAPPVASVLPQLSSSNARKETKRSQDARDSFTPATQATPSVSAVMPPATYASPSVSAVMPNATPKVPLAEATHQSSTAAVAPTKVTASPPTSDRRVSDAPTAVPDATVAMVSDSKVTAGFFDDDDDGEDKEQSTPVPTVDEEPREAPPVRSVRTARVAPTKAPQAAAAPAVTVDVSAMLAQMQSALQDGTLDGDEGDVPSDKKAKRDKTAKKAKKEKVSE